MRLGKRQKKFMKYTPESGEEMDYVKYDYEVEKEYELSSDRKILLC